MNSVQFDSAPVNWKNREMVDLRRKYHAGRDESSGAP